MNKKNGYTLIELIVVIAIVAALAGIATPQFVKYVAKNRATACRTNREAIIKVFEKSVYEGCVPLDTDGLTELMAGTLVAIPDYYQGEVNDHNLCTVLGTGNPTPFKGEVDVDTYTMVAKVTLECKCDDHKDDVVVLDFVGWNKDNPLETDDPGLPSPPPEPGVTSSPDPDPSATPGPTVPVPTKSNSFWPYLDDPRWDGKRWQGQSVDIDAGNLFRDNGVKYALIDTAGGKWTGKGKFSVHYEWADGPWYIDGEESIWERVIQLSGVVYRESDITSWTNKNHDQAYVPVQTGDVFIQNGYVFVFFHTGTENPVNMPKYDGNGGPDNKYGNWFCVGTEKTYNQL